MDPPTGSTSQVYGANRGCSLAWRAVRIAVVVGINLSLILFCLWPIITSENFGKPQGKDIPDTPPSEADRVANELGFSIVVPEHWEARSTYFEREKWGTIGAFPRSVLPRRYSASLHVSNLGASRPKALSQHRPVQFQGRPAYEAVTLRQATEDPPWFSYTLIFERSGGWYELSYGLAEERKTLPPEVWPYFNTFRDSPRDAP